MRYFLGPLSKNIVDAVIDYSKISNREFVFIPSRRQIDYKGGYVNNWTTMEFTRYVREHSTLKIERDHSGPGQGTEIDDGLVSLCEDASNFDIIHIDPWKAYPAYADGLEWTIRMIKMCDKINPNLLYEIGTEESIRPFTANSLDQFVTELSTALEPQLFQKIKYLVIQCGTALLEKHNIGTYDPERLHKMLDVCLKHKLIAKEHNGDWVSADMVREKERQGLDCINIAPELGTLETQTVLNHVKHNTEHFNALYKLCLDSNKWVKWVSTDFKPDENKEDLILICGHYVFSSPQFQQIKSQYPTVDADIRKALTERLENLI
jgi:fructose/tagatose bisphosphate aldolase